MRAAGGAQKWFRKQLSTAYDGSADDLADWWPDLHLDPAALWDQQVDQTRGGYRVMYDYGRRLLVRRLISPRPVLEVMQEFEDAVESVGQDLVGRVRLRLLGPVAPYDFVEEE